MHAVAQLCARRRADSFKLSLIATQCVMMNEPNITAQWHFRVLTRVVLQTGILRHRIVVSASTNQSKDYCMMQVYTIVHDSLTCGKKKICRVVDTILGFTAKSRLRRRCFWTRVYVSRSDAIR